MSNFIRELHKKEIEELAKDHSEALIAFGSDLYRQGLAKGAIAGMTAGLIGVSFCFVNKELKKAIKQVKNKKES